MLVEILVVPCLLRARHDGELCIVMMVVFVDKLPSSQERKRFCFADLL